MMSIFDERYSVNKRRCGWRVSAEVMFLEETLGGPGTLKRDLVVSWEPKTEP